MEDAALPEPMKSAAVAVQPRGGPQKLRNAPPADPPGQPERAPGERPREGGDGGVGHTNSRV